jgi:hypothetical protein
VAKLPANAAKGVRPADAVNSISCAAAGNCSAVGSYIVRPRKLGHSEGLLLTEHAGRWETGVEAVLPADAAPHPQVDLTSISCVSAGNCTAVGSYESGSWGIYSEGGTSGLLLTERAGHWRAGVEARLPANATSDAQVDLTSVSCASAGNCTAVGTYHNNSGGIYGEGGTSGLLLTESAGHWRRGIEAPLPADADASRPVLLPSVSCSRDGRCSAAGTYNIDYGRDSYAGEGVLLTRERGRWRAVEAVMPPDGPGEGVILSSVSCASGGNCSATGLYNINIDGELGPEGVLLNEKAGTWLRGVTAMPPKNSAGGYWKNYVGLTDISCASPGACVAVGLYKRRNGTHLTLLTEAAGKWSRGVEPAQVSGAEMQEASISCASARSCTVVGDYSYYSTAYDFLWTEIAGRWSREVMTSNDAYDDLRAVSCAGPGKCGALGFNQPYFGGSGYGVLYDSTTRPCVVPALRGKTLSGARHSVQSHGCSVGSIKHARSQKIERGDVVSQRPGPGRHLAPWSKVNLTVSSGS